MKKNDWFLIGIVAAVALLIIITFVVLLRSPAEPGYRPDDGPEAAAYNYLLALHQRDEERAYQYLSPDLAGYPQDAAQFSRQVRDSWWREELQGGGSLGLKVQDSSLTGDQAMLTMVVSRFHQGGLFESGQIDNNFKLVLKRTPGGWKIIRSDNYWLVCWEDPAMECNK